MAVYVASMKPVATAARIAGASEAAPRAFLIFAKARPMIAPDRARPPAHCTAENLSPNTMAARQSATSGPVPRAMG